MKWECDTNTAESNRHSKRARVEEDEDDEGDSDGEGSAGEENLFIKDFPQKFGAGIPKGHATTAFETLHNTQREMGRPPWHPFDSEEEWELAQWLITSGISQKKLGQFLNLQLISYTNTIEP
ncbi:hypothetical protein BDQ17DRAFT_1437652 [Cyathus striatus]|nr:hypothetical protein BDQ17DRAFT_1437652 [Cyathus striatus]